MGWVAILSEVALQHPLKLVECLSSTHSARRAARIPGVRLNSERHPA
jgi:hypothetical protein